MFDIAFHAGGKSSQIKDIAERQAIPPRFLEQIFQDLKRAGLVSSKRGPRGGYQLAQPARDISLGDIVRALEGELRICTPQESQSASGDAPNLAVTEAAFRELSERIEECFDAITLEDLCERAQTDGLTRAAPGGYVYVI